MSNELDFLSINSIDDNSLKELAEKTKKLKEKREKIKKLEIELKAAKKEEAEISSEDIPTFLNTIGIKEIKLLDNSKVSIKKDVYVSLPKKDENKKKEVLKFLANKGGGYLIKNLLIIEDPGKSLIDFLKEEEIRYSIEKNVNTNSLKAFFRDLLGINKNSIQRIELNEIPKEVGLFIKEETTIN